MSSPQRRIGLFVLLVVIFLLLSVVFGYAAIIFSRETLDFSDEPIPLTLPAAIEASQTQTQWILLQNIEALYWDCNSIMYRVSGNSSKWTNVIVTNPAQSVVLAVDLSGRFTCDDLWTAPPELSGKLDRLTGADYAAQNFQRRLEQYPSEATYLSLCTYCKAERFGLTLLFSWFGTTVSLTLMFVALNRALRTAAQLRLKAIPAIDYQPDENGPDTHLMQVFNFTAADLTANQLGTLSSRQREYLSQRLHWLIGFFIVVDIGLGLLVFYKVSLFDDRMIDILTLIAAGLALAGAPILAGLDFMSSQRIRKGRVSMISGAVTLRTKTVQNAIYHYAIIANTDFYVTPEQYAVLVNGRFYRIYYLDGIFDFTHGKRKVLAVQSL